ASITIDDSGIKLVCPGMIKIQAVKKALVGGALCHYTAPKEPYDEMYVVKDTLGNIIAGFAYKIETSEGKVYRGVTNEKGETIRVGTGNKAVEFELTADTDEEDK
ncbi:hypothetical protein AAJP47_10060, partial [Psychrobacter sp. B38]|uniref:hypothetical protein n=1 Tax=Psychrobacter sp. B38 TaxID=3143538 RepID=UPI00320F18E4